jgi:hypothetical protein
VTKVVIFFFFVKLLHYNRTIEEDDDSLSSPSWSHQNIKQEGDCRCLLHYNKRKKEGDGRSVTVTFFVATRPKHKKVTTILLLSPSSLQQNQNTRR